jgi:ankyrin repeat protein
MTPLHLAVMSGNGRIVKKLLIRGCDRNIPNYSGKLALDIAKENDYKNIADMIIDKAGIEELLNIKNPFRKIGKRTFPFYFFLAAFFINYLLNVSFVISSHFST